MSKTEWERAYPGSTDYLECLARKNKGDLEEDKERIPGVPAIRSVHWVSGSIDYKLDLALVPETLIAVAAWKDDEQTLTRRSLPLVSMYLSTSADTEVLKTTVEEMIEQLRGKEALFNIEDHEEITITPLSPPRMIK